MYNINIPASSDGWYALGQLLGRAGAKMYENSNRRAGYKESNNLIAQQAADTQTGLNNALQNAYNTYDNKKTSAVNSLQSVADAYNQNQNADTWGNMIAAAKKIDPTFNSSDSSAMTNLINSLQSGSSSYLTPYRQAAQTAALAVNPNTDLNSSDWGASAYNTGVSNLGYINNYQNSNKGKTVSGSGDNKFNTYATYAAKSPTALVSGALGSATPITMNTSANAVSPLSLTNGSQLDGNWDDLNKLMEYVNANK